MTAMAALLLFGLFADAQNSQPPVYLKTIATGIVDFETDNLGNVYLMTARQGLKKINASFDSVSIYNEVRRFGPLSALDASNPLKILLFYRDYGAIVVLDRFLTVRSTINLRQNGILQCSAIAQSFDNNIWVFDDMDSRVKKINDDGRILLETAELRMVLDAPPHPTALVDYNKYLYAHDSTLGLMVMDYYGAYKNVIPFKGWRNIQGFSKGILGTTDEGLEYFEPGSISTKTIALPKDLMQARKLRLYGNTLFVLLDTGNLNLYRLN